VDLQRLHPGLYLVGIRQVGWSWAYYPVVLKLGRSGHSYLPTKVIVSECAPAGQEGGR